MFTVKLTCQVCQYRFCVGDKFLLHFHVVLCEADYYDVTSIFQQIPYYMLHLDIMNISLMKSSKRFLS